MKNINKLTKEETIKVVNAYKALSEAVSKCKHELMSIELSKFLEDSEGWDIKFYKEYVHRVAEFETFAQEMVNKLEDRGE